ncbi:MAG: hypothetical protein PSX36_03700 [bacterium]|nr:hypothetical protein [bacterium]
MRTLCFIYLVTSLSLSLFSQKGSTFPTISGKGLDDKDITVPFKNGKYTVLAIAFNRGAEDDLKKWLNPLFNAFIKSEKQSSTDMELAEVYDVNFVFIPVIAGFKRIADDFRQGTDKQFWGYVMDTEKTDVKGLERKLNVQDSKIPYFYVLDAAGKIIEFESGKFNSSKLDRLEEAIE